MQNLFSELKSFLHVPVDNIAAILLIIAVLLTIISLAG
jgi:hypothetical protein